MFERRSYPKAIRVLKWPPDRRIRTQWPPAMAPRAATRERSWAPALALEWGRPEVRTRATVT